VFNAISYAPTPPLSIPPALQSALLQKKNMKAPITTSGNVKHNFTSPIRIDGVVAGGKKRLAEGCQPSERSTKMPKAVKKPLMVG
jgi:hypothetical protein